MRFNPDPNKQIQEVIFSRKINKIDHPLLYFNQNLVKSSSTHKHLGTSLQNNLPRTSLITIFKSYIRPHLDYEDIIYDRAYNSSFHENIESIQYNAA